MASLTQEGQQYSGYVSELQDYLQTNGIDFVINRKFQESVIHTPSADMSMVIVHFVYNSFIAGNNRCNGISGVIQLFFFISSLQYLNNLKDRHVRIIIGEFFVHAARNIICEAYKLEMTQKQGYVWFLPGWYSDNWYDLDALRQDNMTYNGDDLNHDPSSTNQETTVYLPNCTTAQMVEVRPV